jgi:alkanesulfonate monooxygenase SsuD/methylene tetrahydromethanopterin reductase-like flavin-dependent oxidoreductase (luciferase family)
MKEKLAFLFRNDKIRENLEFSGLKVDQEAVMAAIAKRDVASAMKLVPEEAIDALTITGDAAECRRRIDAYLNAGLDEIVLSLVGSAEDRMRSLDLLATL